MPVKDMQKGIPTKRLIFSFGYTLIVSIGLFLVFSGWVYDDPFITYRYAENLARGLGFVYNPGERILSTTTPLFALGLTPFVFMGEQLPRIAVLIGTISLALGGLLVWDLGRIWDTPQVGWAGLILYPTFPLLLMTLGSETPVYLAFCLGIFTAYLQKRYTWVGLLAGLAILTRPDAAVLVLILVADFLLRRRETIPWKAVAISLGLLVAWVVFAWIYFGSPVPVTLAAKQHQGSMAISQRFAAGLLTIASGYSSWTYLLEGCVVIAGVVLAIWKKRVWLLFLIWPLAYFLAYSILGVSRYFWYYAPLVPGLIVCLGLGLTWIPLILHKSSNRFLINRSWVIPISVAVLLGVFLFGQVRSMLALYQNPDRRATIYRAVGEWLENNTSVGDRVGALEVGIIGYYARRPMVDFAGLIQPEVAAQLKAQTTYEEAALWAVDNLSPKYLVLQSGVFPRLEADYVSESCAVQKIFRGEKYGYSQDLNVFACGK